MYSIPPEEYKKRLDILAAKIKEKGLDLAVVYSTESDFADVRYLSDYWPIFEKAGVVVPADGTPILLIGPESEAFARDRSKIKDIAKMKEFREIAEPEYPDIPVETFKDVFERACGSKEIKRIGIIGWSIFPYAIIKSIEKDYPGVEFVKADDLLADMRVIKSENEIALLEKAFEIAELAIEEIIKVIRPGMTELQIVGIAQKVIYENGAEYEGMPQYVLSGRNSTHAISRPTNKTIGKNELVQLNISARVGGYSSGVGRPIYMGKMPKEVREVVEFGLKAHDKTMEFMKAGVPAKEVVNKYYSFVKEHGYEKYLLYGPCHGLGMMEVERPWMETTSDYLLTENMAFQIDTFFQVNNDYGFRWEDGVIITKEGVRELSNRNKRIIEID